MGIEEYFKPYDYVDAIFDPIPSYDGKWYFSVTSLFENCDIKNAFNEFYHKTYEEPLYSIFPHQKILNEKPTLVSMPNENGVGRTLRYSKIHFYSYLISLLNNRIDSYGKSSEDQKNYIQSLCSLLSQSYEELHTELSNAFKNKMVRLKDVLDKEIESAYFDAAMQDFALYQSDINFKTYIENEYNFINILQTNILKLNNFFDQDIDFHKLASCFKSDDFALLFSKIILEECKSILKSEGHLDSGYDYLFRYFVALQEKTTTDKTYNPNITYIYPSGKRVRYNRYAFKDEFTSLLECCPEMEKTNIPNLQDLNNPSYKNINFMEKLRLMNKKEIKNNWVFLENEEIKKSEKSDNIEVNETNMRIEILTNSGFITHPLKGLSTLTNYYVFIYPSGMVLIEKLWEDDKFKPANEYSYVMSIDVFLEMSKIPNINLVSYAKTGNVGIKKIPHTSINKWQTDIYESINNLGSETRLNEVKEFISYLESRGLKNE